MTPKEKAKDLFEKYCEALFDNEIYVNKSKHKKCVLICVDEILSNINIKYWEKVKEEINKL